MQNEKVLKTLVLMNLMNESGLNEAGVKLILIRREQSYEINTVVCMVSVHEKESDLNMRELINSGLHYKSVEEAYSSVLKMAFGMFGKEWFNEQKF